MSYINDARLLIISESNIFKPYFLKNQKKNDDLKSQTFFHNPVFINILLNVFELATLKVGLGGTYYDKLKKFL